MMRPQMVYQWIILAVFFITTVSSEDDPNMWNAESFNSRYKTRTTSDISRIPDPVYSRPGLRSVYWLHIEKTSSWIYNFLLVWACPEASSQALHASQYYDPNEKSGIKKSSHHFFISRFSYFDELNNQLKGSVHSSKLPQNMAIKSAVWNCSVTFDAFATGFGYHLGYHSPLMNHTVITMLRNPTDRIISAFLFGVMIPMGSPYMFTAKEKQTEISNSTIPIQTYVKTLGIPSCQTKMILGHPCGKDMTLTENDLIEAKRRLNHDMYFFGLTEESEASARLFLEMHHKDGGRPDRRTLEDFEENDPPFFFTTLRKSRTHTASMHLQLAKELQDIGWRDRFDDELFEEGKRIFYARCRDYNIKTTITNVF